MNASQKKKILRRAIKGAGAIMKVSSIEDMHPNTLGELALAIHQVQNILIAEYARHTRLKDEIGLS